MAIAKWLLVAGLGAWPLACFGTYGALEASGSTSAASVPSSTSAMATAGAESTSASETTTVALDESSSGSGSGSDSDSGAEQFLCDELDILLMVDRRSSINNHINSLIGALLESTETLNETLAGVRDYHFGSRPLRRCESAVPDRAELGGRRPGHCLLPLRRRRPTDGLGTGQRTVTIT